MKVLKFGGTSVGTVDSLRNVKRIVESLDAPAVIVVSALGGLTDCLIRTAHEAECGTGDFDATMVAIRMRHHDIIDELVVPDKRNSITDAVDKLLDELHSLYLGVSLINELPPRTLDRIVSFGERMSSLIVSAVIENAQHVDSLQFMVTEKWMDRNIADRDEIDRKVRAEITLPLGNHVVTGGFISRDRDNGFITNLGRGGSDYTAALIAAALNADSLEIWTDVDGFMTSDPRVIHDARVISHMTFVESMELCSFGAKVIYPPTIYPVFHKNIPIRILNTHNPGAPGTLITDNSEGLEECVRGVSAVRNAAMVTVRGALASNMPEINSRTYNAMARAGITVLLVTQPDEEEEFSVTVPVADIDEAVKVMNTEFAPELGNGSVTAISERKDLSVLAVVREGIRKMEGLGRRLYSTLMIGGVDVLGLSDGTSEATIALVVNDCDAAKALELVHDAVILRN